MGGPESRILLDRRRWVGWNDRCPSVSQVGDKAAPALEEPVRPGRVVFVFVAWRVVSMSIKPIVRYMIACEDWGLSPSSPKRINIYGLLSNISSTGNPPYPFLFRELCVFLALTEARG